MFTLFLHSLLLTPCISQNANTTSSESTINSLSQETTAQQNQSTSTLTKVSEIKEICRPPPNLTTDAISLRKAMEGFGTDVFTIIDLVAMRSNDQRQEIRKIYKDFYNTVNIIYEYEIKNSIILTDNTNCIIQHLKIID